MVAPKDIAKWMLDKMTPGAFLYQDTVAREIVEQFGKEFTYTNKDGGLAISRKVLDEFRKLTGNDVVWERCDKLWRRRETYDRPGRQQD